MGLKHHTIIFVPNSRAKFRKWRISNRQLQVAVALVALLTGTAAFITWSYLTKEVSLDELARLREENTRLLQTSASFEQSLGRLQKQLTEYEDRTKSLAIVAGLESLSVSQSETRGAESGIGGSYTAPHLDDGYDLELLEGRSSELSFLLNQVEDELAQWQLKVRSKPAITPVKGIFTSKFGQRNDPLTGRPAQHLGIDISAAPGHDVVSTADGVVTHAGRIGSFGRVVYISHGFGVATRYGHLSKIDVEPGQRVKRGDVIGFVGNSGRSTGYHLHYEVRVEGRPQDPRMFMEDQF